MRRALLSLDLDFNVFHVPGTIHHVPDALLHVTIDGETIPLAVSFAHASIRGFSSAVYSFVTALRGSGYSTRQLGRRDALRWDGAG